MNCGSVKQLVTKILATITTKFPPVSQSADGGLYAGAAGVGYVFYAIAEKPVFHDQREEYLKTALGYMTVR